MTDRDAVDAWVQRYVLAWASNDPDDVRGLFTPDAHYRFHPWDEAILGHEAIVAAWLDAADGADDHGFDYRVVAVDGGTAVVEGHTRYTDGDAYENLWVIQIADDGRATAFTEWYMQQPGE